MANDRRVRIYPVLDQDGNPKNYVHGVPAEEMLLEADEADRLLAYYPPAFSRTRPPGQKAPSEEPLEEPPAGLPPTTGPADAGPSDSEE